MEFEEKKEKSLPIWKNEIRKKKTNFERMLFDQSTYPEGFSLHQNINYQQLEG